MRKRTRAAEAFEEGAEAVLDHSSVVARYDGGRPRIEAELEAPALERMGS